jgi:putative NADPH-quinone reductase
MTGRVLIIQGHPDSSSLHFGHALAEAYAEGALAGGREVKHIAVAQLQFPLLHSKADWDAGPCPPELLPAQESIRWADHIFIIYPLWLGSMPAVLKAFFEQIFRPEFTLDRNGGRTAWGSLLKGRTARIVVTMGMPAVIYRWFFMAHSLRSLKRNILSFVGIRPVRTTVIGQVEAAGDERRAAWLREMRYLGAIGR